MWRVRDARCAGLSSLAALADAVPAEVLCSVLMAAVAPLALDKDRCVGIVILVIVAIIVIIIIVVIIIFIVVVIITIITNTAITGTCVLQLLRRCRSWWCVQSKSPS